MALLCYNELLDIVGNMVHPLDLCGVWRNHLNIHMWWSGDIYIHDDVIKWKYFPRYWPFVRGIHRRPVNSPHKGQWRGALMVSLICVWIDGWVNNRKGGDLRRHRGHYDVTVMRRITDMMFAPKCLNTQHMVYSRYYTFRWSERTDLEKLTVRQWLWVWCINDLSL